MQTPINPRTLYAQAQVVSDDLYTMFVCLEHDYTHEYHQHTPDVWAQHFERLGRVAWLAARRAQRRHAAYVAHLTQGAV